MERIYDTVSQLGYLPSSSITQLRAGLKGRVFTPQDADYDSEFLCHRQFKHGIRDAFHLE